MTDDISDKVRALFLTALMVFSVFGGTVAFAGTAAAVDDVSLDADATAGPTTVQETTTVEHNFVFNATNVTDDGNADTVTITLPDAASVGGAGDVSINSVENESGNTFSTDTSVSSASGNEVVLSVNPNTNADNQNLTFDLNVTVDWGSVDSDTTADATFEVADDDGTTASTTVPLTIEDNGLAPGDDGVTAVGDSVGDQFAGQTVAISGFTPGETVSIFEGLSTNPGNAERVETNRANDNGVVTFDTSGLNTDFHYISNGTGAGDNDLTTNDFEIVAQDLSTSFAEDSVGVDSDTQVDFTVSSENRNEDFDIEVSVDEFDAADYTSVFGVSESALVNDSNGNAVAATLTVTGGESTFTLDFDGLSAANYTLTTDVADTDASAESTITAEELGNAQATVTGQDIAQGDVAEITVGLNEAADSATLTIGDEASVNYELVVDVTDVDGDGEVTVLFNTYLAGQGDVEGLVATPADSDDTVTVDTDASGNINTAGILETGNYDLEVTATDSVQDVGTLFLDDPSFDTFQLWTASPSNVPADATPEDVATLIENDQLTQTDAVTNDDLLVHQIGATGVEGLFDANDGVIGSISPDDAGNGTSLTFVETDASTGPNDDPVEIPIAGNEDAISVIQDPDTGNYYVILDTSEDLTVDDPSGDEGVLGKTFTVEFSVQDDRLLGSSADEDHLTQSADFDLEESTFEFDQDEFTVNTADNQSITGQTNLAPGTEFTLRVRTTGGADPGFAKSDTVTVQADGTFEAQFDFTTPDGIQNATEFQISVSGDDRISGTTATGTVIVSDTTTETPTPATTEATPTDEPEPTPTDTPEPTPTDTPEPTATDTPETDEPTDTTETTEETTETTTPGFTAVLGILALLGAALLALRRQE